MTILVHDRDLLALCGCRSLAKTQLGQRIGGKLIQRISELMAADSFDEFKMLKHVVVSVESLPPNPTFSVVVQDSVSLLIRPAAASGTSENSSSLDLTQVKEVEILTLYR